MVSKNKALTKKLLAMDRRWEKKGSLFIEDVASSRFPMLQGMLHIHGFT